VLRGGGVTVVVVVWLLRFSHHRISCSSGALVVLGLLVVALFFRATVDGAVVRISLICLICCFLLSLFFGVVEV